MSETLQLPPTQAPSAEAPPPRGPTPLRGVAATVRNCASALPGWCRYRLTKPLTIVVLGMHRSGTSCITRMINLCGASVGPEVVGANDWNKEGHWEALEGVIINDGLLRLSGGSWDHPPEKITCDLRLRWKLKGFLGRLHATGTAVLKDPRTTVTFPIWKPLLQRYHVVAAFRHPVSVARSLQHRDGFDLERALDLWRVYNEHLLAICEQERDVEWIDFDRSAEGLVQVVQRIARKAGLNYSDQVFESYRPELRTSDARDLPKDERLCSIYRRLQENSARCK